MADLPETEAAIVTEGGCSRLSLLLPNFADQEEMPRLVLALTACFIRLDKDPAFLEEQLDWMDEQRSIGRSVQ